VSDITLYSIRSGILSQWSVLITRVMWWRLGSFSNSTVESILNNLEAFTLGDDYVQKKELQ